MLLRDTLQQSMASQVWFSCEFPGPEVSGETILEVGVGNVVVTSLDSLLVSGTAWASSMGKSGKRSSHIEEALHRAASQATGDVAGLRNANVVTVFLLPLV